PNISQQNFGPRQEFVEHLEHDYEHQGCKKYFELVSTQFLAELGPELSTYGRSDEQQQRQDEIHSVVLPSLHDCNIHTGEKNLEQTRSHDDVHGHPQQVNHYRNHDESAAHAHYCRQDSDKRSEYEWSERRKPHTGTREFHLPGQTFQYARIRRIFLLPDRVELFFDLAHRLEALGEHVAPDGPEHQHIGEIDQEI